jgi:hypothetical protein
MTMNDSPSSLERPCVRPTMAALLLLAFATSVACDRDDGAPEVTGDDPTVNLGPLRSACIYDENWGILEDWWCQEYYGSYPYTQEQWDQIACPVGTVAREGCSRDPRTGFDGVCRIAGSMDGQWMVMLLHTYGFSEETARAACEDDEEASIGIPGLIESVTFHPPWE